MPERRTMRCAWIAACTVLAGCTTAGVPAGPSPAPAAPAPVAATAPARASEEILRAYAELIRLEDRREWDEGVVARHAASPDPRVRARAALALGRLRDPSGASLLRRLVVDADSAVAATAAFSMGQLRDSLLVPDLVGPLRSADPARSTVAAEAAYALGKVGGTSARDALLEYLRTAPSSDRAAGPVVGSALLAIWRLPVAPDLAPLLRWLASPDAELRWRAAYALSRRPDPRAFAPLRERLDDPDPRVRSFALRAMTGALADSAGVPRGTVLVQVARLAADSAYGVSINALRALGSYAAGDALAVETLSTAAAGADPHRVVTALESLARLGTARDPAAIGALAGDDAKPVAVRGAAIEALAAIDSCATARIAGALGASPDWRLRAASARALARIDQRPGTRIRGALRDPDTRVANAALQAAVDAAGDSLAPLRALLIEQLGAGDPIVRATALTALARIAEPSLLPLLLDAYARAASDTVNDAALAAVDAIGAARTPTTDPARAFLTRFPRSGDALVRVRVLERLDSAAVLQAWGPPLPIETGRDHAEYRRLVQQWVAPALEGSAPPRMRIVTAGDSIDLVFFPLDATLTLESFSRLAEGGFFDGQEWPRVVPNFVVQGGDPRGDTSGGPGYTIRDELNRHRYGVGTLGMALAGPDTGGSQFFLTHSPQPHLDGTYAVFGQALEAEEVMERLLPGDRIESIRRVP